jgi:hypothetical protein
MINAFKAEIIEAEKSRTDLLKWKLIIVAALGAVGLGIGFEVPTTTSTTMSPILTLSLIPLAATYVDLLCKHLQLRILVISEFFHSHCTNKEISDFISYETFTHKVRIVFDLEDWAQIGSTLFLSILVILVAYLLKLSESEFWVLLISGCIGLLSSLLIYLNVKRKIRILKEERTNGAQAPERDNMTIRFGD